MAERCPRRGWMAEGTPVGRAVGQCSCSLGVATPPPGVLNVRMEMAEDWPSGQSDLQPQHSVDRARVDALCLMLLEFCEAQGSSSFAARLGDRHGARASREVWILGEPPTSFALRAG